MPDPEQAATSNVVPKAAEVAARLASVDVYRGFVMLLMASEVMEVPDIAEKFQGSALWDFVHHHTTHIEWIGCSLWDLIQPSFTFLAGLALTYSAASRLAKGQSWAQGFRHALWRGFALSALGIFLRSTHSEQTNFTFEDTLTQIGLGYPIAYLFAGKGLRLQAIGTTVILVGYWLAWAVYPTPGPNFDWAAVGVKEDWQHLTGFAAHWDKNSNLGAAFDVWFMNLFPRPNPYTHNGGGYLTLSFIPTLGTMLLGLMTGGLIRSESSHQDKLKRMALWGVAGLAAGWLLNITGICPVVKRIWTPSWTLFSGGWCLLLMAGFYYLVDFRQWRKWAFPLTVIGMNSLAMYWMAHVTASFIKKNLVIHLGKAPFLLAGEAFEPVLLGAAVLTVEWVVLYWMRKRKLFLRL